MASSPMRRFLVALLVLPVVAWASISYALVPHVIAALGQEPIVGGVALATWFGASVFLLLALRRLARSLRSVRKLRTY